MSSLQIGRLLVGPPSTWTESAGDSVQSAGGAVVPGSRTALQFQVALATWAADGQTDTVAARLSLRRRLRSLLSNMPLKLQGFLYVQYSDDPEQNGWYVPDTGQLTDLTSPVGLATGLWQIQNPWYRAGARRTHREAREVWMKDLRTGLYARDYLGWILTTDFSGLPALQLSVLPNGASSVGMLGGQSAVALPPLPTGRDGGACSLVEGLSDMAVVSYERAESALNLSDVIVYDRRGQITAPSTGPDTSWEEAYGSDYPWNWLTAGQSQDTPVLDNGLVRVRWDGANTPGFRVDVWSGSAYVEQGKMLVYRVGDSPGWDDTWVSASLAEWTPERAVVAVVLSSSVDGYSRERVFVTVQRGEMGVTFECYPALKQAGTQADVKFLWTPNGPDSNDSIMWEPSTAQPPSTGTDQIWSTASSNWTSAAGTFSSSTSNFVSVLRCIGGATTVGPFQTTLSVVQQSTQFAGVSDAHAYGGAAQSAVALNGSGGLGYLQVQLAFAATQSDQVQGSGSSWSAAINAQYRVLFYNGTSWTDAGEYSGSAVSTTGATRVEAYETQDRSRNGAIWAGCRDVSQAALFDSRMLGCLVARV